MKYFATVCILFLSISCGKDSNSSNNDDTDSNAGDPGDSNDTTHIIFIAQEGNLNGALGGITGADDICMNNLVNGVTTAKALLGVTGVRDINNDWPLAANTTYYREDGTTEIGTTDGGGMLQLPLTNSISSGLGEGMWTGLQANGQAHSDNCINWTRTNAGNGQQGFTDRTSAWSISEDLALCNTFAGIYCVSQ